MSLPLNDAVVMGYEPPLNVQFRVFLDNRVGKLLEVVDVFCGHAINLVTLSIVDSTEHAVVRLLTSTQRPCPPPAAASPDALLRGGRAGGGVEP